jgi:hypothetical protein
MTTTTELKRRSLSNVIFRVAAIIGILGVILYLVTIAVPSFEILYTSYSLLAFSAFIAAGTGIALFAMKPKKP